MLRFLFVLLVFAALPSIASAQYHYPRLSNGITENPFYTAMKREEKAKRAAIAQLNADLKALREHLDKGGLVEAKSLEEMSYLEVAQVARDAEELNRRFVKLRDKFNSEGASAWTAKLSESNKEFAESDGKVKTALELLKTQELQASAYERKLKSKREADRAKARRRMQSYSQNSRLQHSNNFGLDYDRYQRTKSSFNRKTQELIEKIAIIDMLDDRDTDAIDAKLKALGY